MNELKMSLGDRSYRITVGQGLLADAGRYFNLDRRVLILTDGGVPTTYSHRIAECCKEAEIMTLPEGEATKCLSSLEAVLIKMTEMNMTREDCVVAVGGGVIGDLAGLCAALYMRGIDFYNVPTTLLSQVDSSIGGKTAINLGGYKNTVGAFHQPRGVLIDTDTLDTLDIRQYRAGLAEVVKMAVTSDEKLFARLESMPSRGIGGEIEYIILSALKIKKKIVERDERESGERRLLNLGHTLGHGIEASACGALLHGECVAIGMLPMLGEGIRDRVRAVLERLGLPTKIPYGVTGLDPESLSHDKKATEGGVSCVLVDRIGEGYIRKLSYAELISLAEGIEVAAEDGR